MADASRQGITHILNLSSFDNTKLAKLHGIRILWNYVSDDLAPKSPEVFRRGVKFAKPALAKKENKLLILCAAGMHRAPDDGARRSWFDGMEAAGRQTEDQEVSSGRRLPRRVRRERAALSSGRIRATCEIAHESKCQRKHMVDRLSPQTVGLRPFAIAAQP